MTVTVDIDSVFAEFTEGERTLDLAAATGRQLVDDLTQRYPRLRQEILEPSGELKSYVELLSSSGQLYMVLGLDDEIPDGSTVRLKLEQIAGG